jgi:hypothetical protein
MEWTMYSERWPRQGLMRNGHVFRRQVWVPAIKEIGGGVLRTPTVGMVNQDRSQDPQYMSKLLAKGQTVTLAAQMKSAEMLPTPRANDAEKRGNFDPHNPRNGLPAAVMLLPTPRATDGDKATRTPQGAQRELERGRNKDLGMFAALLPTPVARDWKGVGRADQLPTVLTPTGAATYLNPSFVEEMMGFPVGWTV